MQPKLLDLQGLPAIACLTVVLYHIAGKESFVPTPYPVLGPLMTFGYAGVDLFFALSGFIITHAHYSKLGHPAGLRDFLVRRLGAHLPRLLGLLPGVRRPVPLHPGPALLPRLFPGRVLLAVTRPVEARERRHPASVVAGL